METSTIAVLIRPFAELSPELLQQTSAYIDLLLKWNAKVNLTSVRDPREIVTRHFGESFFAASRLFSSASSADAATVIDVGSGAGFPGLPLAMFAPSAQVTLIESNAKKVAFLNEVISALGLKNARVARQRAEEYPATAELVTMRAVEAFAKAVLVAHNLVSDGGRLALMIGATQVPLAKAQVGEMSWEEAVPVPASHSRVLCVGRKGVRGIKT